MQKPIKCPVCGDCSQIKIFVSGDSSQSLDFGCETCGKLFIMHKKTGELDIWSEAPQDKYGPDDIGNWITLKEYFRRKPNPIRRPFIFR